MPRQTLVEKASQQITAYIAAHSLTAGDRLPTEAELAALLGVGRNTVREALKSLASRNILTIRQGSGCFLSEKRGVADDPLGFSTVGDRRKLTQDLMQIRLLIEPEIAALAAQNALPEEAERLAQTCADVEADIAAGRDFSAADRAFHEALAFCTHNTVMARLIPIISEGVLCFAVTVGTPEYVQTVRSHRAILEAVRGHRPCEARREMEYHLLFNQNRFSLAGQEGAAPENAPQRSGERP